jgi:hypothetical protein
MCEKVNGRTRSELKGKEAQALLFQLPCHYGSDRHPELCLAALSGHPRGSECGKQSFNPCHSVARALTGL